MAFPCAFLHVVGNQHSGPLCRGWACGGGGGGWAWRLGLAEQQEGRQEPGGGDSGGGAQQGELCPGGGQTAAGTRRGPRRGPGDHSRRGRGQGGSHKPTTPRTQQSNLWACFSFFFFLNGAFIKHQLGPVLSKPHEFLISLNSHRNSPLPSSLPPILQITSLGPREVKSHVPCHGAD